jgi:hypothetical protein
MTDTQININAYWLIMILFWMFFLGFVLYTKLERNVQRSEDKYENKIYQLEKKIITLEYKIKG